MRQSGLADLLSSLWGKTVYVGLSAGSMVVTPTFGENFAVHEALIGTDKGLGLVDFSLLPHLDHERFPENSLANLEKIAASIPAPTYAIDDQTAIKVTDSTIEVVSEGHWKLFTP
jgi:dipeptidase E